MASLFPLTPYTALRSHPALPYPPLRLKHYHDTKKIHPLSMYNLADEGVQFSPTQLFSQMRPGCSASNGRGVQLGRYIHGE